MGRRMGGVDDEQEQERIEEAHLAINDAEGKVLAGQREADIYQASLKTGPDSYPSIYHSTHTSITSCFSTR